MLGGLQDEFKIYISKLYPVLIFFKNMLWDGGQRDIGGIFLFFFLKNNHLANIVPAAGC
jgi:hypothetical protein